MHHVFIFFPYILHTLSLFSLQSWLPVISLHLFSYWTSLLPFLLLLIFCYLKYRPFKFFLKSSVNMFLYISLYLDISIFLRLCSFSSYLLHKFFIPISSLLVLIVRLFIYIFIITSLLLSHLFSSFKSIHFTFCPG